MLQRWIPLLISGLLLASLTLAVLADHPVGDDLTKRVLHRDRNEISLSWSELFDFAPRSSPATYFIGTAYHGTIKVTDQGFDYLAADSLFEIGSDTFMVVRNTLTGSEVRYVAIVAGQPHHGPPSSRDFEADPPAGWTLSESAEIVDLGTGSAMRAVPAPAQDSYSAFNSSEAPIAPHLPICPYFDQGGSGHSSGGDILCDDICTLETAGTFAGEQTILRMDGPQGQRIAEVTLRSGGQQWELQVAGYDFAGIRQASGWYAIPAPRNFLNLRLEIDLLEDSPQDLARLLVDGEAAIHTPPFEAGEVPVAISYFGALDVVDNGVPVIMDNLEVSQYEIHARDEPLHVDHFDGGTLNGELWHLGNSSLTGLYLRQLPRHYPQVSQSLLMARLSEISVAAWLHDIGPQSAPRAVVRFDLDTSAMRGIERVAVLGSLNADTISEETELIRVWVSHGLDGTSSLQVVVNDGSTVVDQTDQLPFVREVRVELHFEIAEDRLTVWLDGELADTLAGVSLLGVLESLRFGAMGASDAESVLYLDEFQLWLDHPPLDCRPPHDPPG